MRSISRQTLECKTEASRSRSIFIQEDSAENVFPALKPLAIESYRAVAPETAVKFLQLIEATGASMACLSRYASETNES